MEIRVAINNPAIKSFITEDIVEGILHNKSNEEICSQLQLDYDVDDGANEYIERFRSMSNFDMLCEYSESLKFDVGLIRHKLSSQFAIYVLQKKLEVVNELLIQQHFDKEKLQQIINNNE